MDSNTLTDLERNARAQEKDGAVAQITAHNILTLIEDYKAAVQIIRHKNNQIEDLRAQMRMGKGDSPVYEPVNYGCNEDGVAVYRNLNSNDRVVYSNGSTHTEIILPPGWQVCRRKDSHDE